MPRNFDLVLSCRGTRVSGVTNPSENTEWGRCTSQWSTGGHHASDQHTSKTLEHINVGERV